MATVGRKYTRGKRAEYLGHASQFAVGTGRGAWYCELKRGNQVECARIAKIGPFSP